MADSLKMVQPILEEFGVPWSVERGTRHLQLYIGGKRAATLPAKMSEDRGRRWAMTRSTIRRKCREYVESAAATV